jgi:hypothetical protein
VRSDSENSIQTGAKDRLNVCVCVCVCVCVYTRTRERHREHICDSAMEDEQVLCRYSEDAEPLLSS